MVSKILRSSALIVPYILLKRLFKGAAGLRSQSDESFIIDKLLLRFEVPRVFVEFGFSGWEFNCIRLTDDWKGLLLDGDSYNVRIAKLIFGANILAERTWITLETIQSVLNFMASNAVGVLSIDVDGNDYWFLEKLIVSRPAIIIVEYNSSLGLRPITVPYDPDFDRITKDPTHTYYGASLMALHLLCDRHGYSLVELSSNGVNAFFVRKDLLTPDDLQLLPENVFREKPFADRSRPSHQWDRIKHLPYVDVLTTF